MLWVEQKGSLSLFSTNTDGCCFEWGLVLLKHDKVRDDMPLVTKVWRSRNASAVAFFQPRQTLVHVSPANKGKMLPGHACSLLDFLCVHVETWKMRKWTKLPCELHKKRQTWSTSSAFTWKLNDTWKRGVAPFKFSFGSTVLPNATKNTKYDKINTTKFKHIICFLNWLHGYVQSLSFLQQDEINIVIKLCSHSNTCLQSNSKLTYWTQYCLHLLDILLIQWRLLELFLLANKYFILQISWFIQIPPLLQKKKKGTLCLLL